MKREETILQTDDVRVRLIELAPGERAPLHHHTEVTDTMFGISGEILVRLQNPEEEALLTPGARCVVRPGRVHQVLNHRPDESSQYLLIQGVGKYDFIR